MCKTWTNDRVFLFSLPHSDRVAKALAASLRVSSSEADWSMLTNAPTPPASTIFSLLSSATQFQRTSCYFPTQSRNSPFNTQVKFPVILSKFRPFLNLLIQLFLYLIYFYLFIFKLTDWLPPLSMATTTAYIFGFRSYSIQILRHDAHA